VQVKGMARAAGVDCYISASAKGMTPPKGLGTAKDQGIFMGSTSNMETIKGFCVTKIVGGKNTRRWLMNFYDYVREDYVA